LGLLINEKSVFKRYLLFTSFSATCAILVFTQGRAGWLAGGCGCALLLLLRSKEVSRKTLSFAGLGVFAYAMGLILKPLWEQQYLNFDLVNRLYALVDNPLIDPNYLFRIDQFAQRWELILRNPLGVNLIDAYTPEYYVHSMYFFLAIGIGVIGLAGFLLMIMAGLATHLDVVTHTVSNTPFHLYASIGLSCILAWMIGGLSEPLGLVSGLSTIMIWLGYYLSFKGATLSQ
jgi:hypothetical protein